MALLCALLLGVSPASAASKAGNSSSYKAYSTEDAAHGRSIRSQIGQYYAVAGHCPHGPVFAPVAERFRKLRQTAEGTPYEIDFAIEEADERWQMRLVRIACPKTDTKTEKAAQQRSDTIAAQLAANRLDWIEKILSEQVPSSNSVVRYGREEANAGAGLREASWTAVSKLQYPCLATEALRPAMARYERIKDSAKGTAAAVDIAVAEANFDEAMSVVDILCLDDGTEELSQQSESFAAIAEEAMDQMEELIQQRVALDTSQEAHTHHYADRSGYSGVFA